MYYKQLPFRLAQDLSNDLFKSLLFSRYNWLCRNRWISSSPNAKYTNGDPVPLTAWVVSSECFCEPVTGGDQEKMSQFHGKSTI